MPRIDIAALGWVGGTGYPEPFRSVTAGRLRKRLGDAVGLAQFGVNLTRLEPGAATAQRHWHEAEDEFVYVLEGEVILIEDAGETVLGPGDAAAFKAGVPDGHHIVNRSARPALLLEIGSRSTDERAHYPDIDLAMVRMAGANQFTRKDGTPYE